MGKKISFDVTFVVDEDAGLDYEHITDIINRADTCMYYQSDGMGGGKYVQPKADCFMVGKTKTIMIGERDGD